MPETEDELAYYREIEDFFSAVRGVPHILSPKDFHLMRGWWRGRVPLAAVVAGITEVFARRRDRGDREDPVVSLGYCKHAVRRHAARLAEMHVGEAPPEAPETDFEQDARGLDAVLKSMRAAADRLSEDFPAVTAAILEIATLLDTAPEMPPAILEEHLFSMEAVLLDRCWRALPDLERDAIDERSQLAAAAAGGTESTRERTRRAVRDRELRHMLGLPRLEVG